MLIRNAQIEGRRMADLRLAAGHIAEIAPSLMPRPDEPVFEAQGGALFPSLHDHHIHLAAFAAALDSVWCGPPSIASEDSLAALLAKLNVECDDWLRGIGYHEGAANLIDRAYLDSVVPARPVRIQHASGRLWIFNSRGLAALDPAKGDPLEREGGRLTGRLYDGDAWLRRKLGSRFPDLSRASRALARWGVTGVTDATASNTRETMDQFKTSQSAGELLQSVLVMGDDSLNGDPDAGPRKFHLHDAELPDFAATVAAIARTHAAGRDAAFHCVTRTDLTFALAALEEAGASGGDRIEHASVAPPELVALMRRLNVTVVTQPNFVFERGDRYLRDVAPEDRPWLYPAASLTDIRIAGGTDAPLASADPWRLMSAAVSRTTRGGRVLGPQEALLPEAAIALFLGRPRDPGGAPRQIASAEAADLVLLNRNWDALRADLSAVKVKATWKAGAVLFRA